MLCLHSPTLETQDDLRVRFSCTVSSDDGRRSLWFSVPKTFGERIRSDLLDPFVIGLLFEASQTGQDIRIEGALSEALHYQVTNGFAYLLSQLTEAGKATKLHPSNVLSASAAAQDQAEDRNVAAGFSAGIDSFQTYVTHNVDPAIDGYRISHFIMNNVGSHGRSDQADRIFAERRTNVARFADEMGIVLIDIDSNLGSFYQDTPFQLTHTLRNVAAATVLQGYLSRFLYSSSFRYDECFVGPTYDMGYTEPFALHLLSTDLLTCISSGSEYSRLEKTINIAVYEPTYRYLDVCINPSKTPGRLNCSRCWKCSRALLTFEALGVLDNYRAMFDLDAFRANRDCYIATTLRDMSKKNPNDADVVDFMRDRILNPPSTAKILALRSRQKIAALRR